MAVCNGNMPFGISSTAHGAALIKGVQDLFNNRRGADFYFRWGGNTVRTHRLILELFLEPEMVTSKRNNSEHQDCENGYEGEILNSLFEFLYTGEVRIKQKELRALLTLAKVLKFKLLVDEIEGIMRTEIYKECEVNEKTCCKRSVLQHQEADSDYELKLRDANSNGQYQKVKESDEFEDVRAVNGDQFLFGSSKGQGFPDKLSKGSFVDVDESMLVEWDGMLKPCLEPIVKLLVSEEETLEDVNEMHESLAKLKSKAVESITVDHSDGSNRRATKHLDSIFSTLPLEGKKCENGGEESGVPDEKLPAEVMIKLEPSDESVSVSMDQCDGEEVGLFEHEEANDEAQLPAEDGLQSTWTTKRIKLEPIEELVNEDWDQFEKDERMIASVDPEHFLLVNDGCDDVPDSVSREPGSLQVSGENPESYSCAHCNFKTPKCHIYYYHLQSAHGLATRLMETPLERNACDLNTTQPSELRHHQIGAHPLVLVALPTTHQYTCRKGDQTVVQLDQHSKIHAKKRHKCDLCPFETVIQSFLKVHLKIVHRQGTCEFTCENCGQRCSTNQTLAENPFSCPYCRYTPDLNLQVNEGFESAARIESKVLEKTISTPADSSNSRPTKHLVSMFSKSPHEAGKCGDGSEERRVPVSKYEEDKPANAGFQPLFQEMIKLDQSSGSDNYWQYIKPQTLAKSSTQRSREHYARKKALLAEVIAKTAIETSDVHVQSAESDNYWQYIKPQTLAKSSAQRSREHYARKKALLAEVITKNARGTSDVQHSREYSIGKKAWLGERAEGNTMKSSTQRTREQRARQKMLLGVDPERIKKTATGTSDVQHAREYNIQH